MTSNNSVAALASQLGYLVSGQPRPRALSTIAADIRAHWTKVSPYALPYLEAMETLDSIHSYYGADSADSIVRYFLANAATWRGEDARRVKAELKSMLTY